VKKHNDLHQARVYLAQAKVRRHQHKFHAVLLSWAANCRLNYSKKIEPIQGNLF
jgi:hypothetical protein